MNLKAHTHVRMIINEIDIEIFAHMGGIVFCKNCYTFRFTPKSLSRLAAVRGGALALDADRNCSSKGVTDVKLYNFTMEDSYSILDAGTLLYSRTDCFMQVNLTDLKVRNVRTNLLQQSTTPFPKMGNQSLDDQDGGGLVKITSATLKMTISKNTLRDIQALNGVGGIFNFNQKEFQGSFTNNTATNFLSKSSGTLLYIKASSLSMNATSNLIRCRDTSIPKSVNFLSDLLDGPSMALQSQAFHLNLTNSNKMSNFLAKDNYIASCYYDGSMQAENNGGNGGGAYYLTSSLSLKDSNSIYEYNSAPYGSIYVCEGCNIAIQNNTY